MSNKRRREASSYTATMRITDGSSKWGKKQYFPFRSRLEIIFAGLLTEIGIEYKYEQEAIKILDEGLKFHYIPDFILSNGKIIEIAAYYNKRMRHKIGLAKLQNPDLEIIVISKNKLDEYRRNLNLLKSDLGYF